MQHSKVCLEWNVGGCVGGPSHFTQQVEAGVDNVSVLPARLVGDELSHIPLGVKMLHVALGVLSTKEWVLDSRTVKVYIPTQEKRRCLC
jgi:hypothetical protein